MSRYEQRDPAPQQHQRREFLLIFITHKRPTQFDRSADLLEELAPISTQWVCVEPIFASTFQDLIDQAQPIRADDLLCFLVPNEQMQIRLIERVDVQRLPTTFTDAAERDLAQATDLAQRVG